MDSYIDDDNAQNLMNCLQNRAHVTAFLLQAYNMDNRISLRACDMDNKISLQACNMDNRISFQACNMDNITQ